MRERLLARKSELLGRALRADADLRRELEPLSPDFSEQVVQRENDEVLERLSDAAHAEVTRIGRALARIDSGHYLQCSRCAGPIEPARIEVVPETDHCSACARSADTARHRS